MGICLVHPQDSEVGKQTRSEKKLLKFARLASLITLNQLGHDNHFFNAEFYLGTIKTEKGGLSLSAMQKLIANYDNVEKDYGLIAWMFPTYHASCFAVNAKPLTKDEAEVFRTNNKIAERVLKSYVLLLDFFGLELIDQETGEIDRNQNYAARYKKAFLTNYHHHLKLTRVLSFLNIVGLRKYAIALVDFLEAEIYGDVGGYEIYKNLSEDQNLDAVLPRFKYSPLSALAETSAFKTWKTYGNFGQNPKRREELETSCMIDLDEYKESVLLKMN